MSTTIGNNNAFLPGGCVIDEPPYPPEIPLPGPDGGPEWPYPEPDPGCGTLPPFEPEPTFPQPEPGCGTLPPYDPEPYPFPTDPGCGTPPPWEPPVDWCGTGTGQQPSPIKPSPFGGPDPTKM